MAKQLEECCLLTILYIGTSDSKESWDMHIRKLLGNGRKRVNQLHKVISNRNINLSACRH